LLGTEDLTRHRSGVLDAGVATLRLSEVRRGDLARRLGEQLARGRAQREAAAVGLAAASGPESPPIRAAGQARGAGRAAPSAVPVDLPRLEPRFCVDVGAPVADLAVGARDGQPCLFAAAGSAVQALDAAGRAVAVMGTGRPCRCCTGGRSAACCWWGARTTRCWPSTPTGGSAGPLPRTRTRPCSGPPSSTGSGRRPGTGASTGCTAVCSARADPKAFAGGACTLEVLEADGSLCRRLPVFWGPGSRFALVPGPAGGTDLLVAREPADAAGLSVVDSDTLQVRASNACHSVPLGHAADCGGFASTTRQHLLLADVNGDGAPELVSEVNGTLSGVTVWELGSGRALASAQLLGGKRVVVGTDQGRVVLL
jgi:hypothetical protein